VALQLKDSSLFEAKDTTFEKSIVKIVKKALEEKNESAKKDREELEKKYGPMGGPPLKPMELVEKKLAGANVYRVASPDDEQYRAMVGDGFGLCFTISNNYLLLASSEPALVRMIEAPKGKNLSGSRELARLLGDAPRAVASFSHFSFEPLIDQIDKNAEVLVRNAAPAPKELGEAPKTPEFPAQAGEKEFEAYKKASEAWQKDNQDYQKKLADFREKNAASNAAALVKILGSLKVLGGTASWESVSPDGIESASVVKLDLAAAQASEVH